MSKQRIINLSKPLRGIKSLQKQFSVQLLDTAFDFLSNYFAKSTTKGEIARIPGKYTEKSYFNLLQDYTVIPDNPSENPRKVYKNIVKDLFGGVPLWTSPNLHYNVGAAPNVVSTALYSTALCLNIFGINDGLAGNTIIAEHAVTRILSDLGGVVPNNSCGFFTFGGTATNLYAIKMALVKNLPDTRKNGLPKNFKVAITEDAHFSHQKALHWLGVGTNNILTMYANEDKTSSLVSAGTQLRNALQNNFRIPIIILNGGTTYDNIIDNIEDFVELRNNLVDEFQLDYIPHIHVDSVIGWAWLMFKDYSFEVNSLNIETATLQLIKSQYTKIKAINQADNWGVDFHKGVGSCPVSASVIMINDKKTISNLSYEKHTDGHQLARELSKYSPVDFTLETSRPAGAAISALGSLKSLGKKGFQLHLANLVQQNQLLRELFYSTNRSDLKVLNVNSPGYVTMLRLYPPDIADNKELEDSLSTNGSLYIKSVNLYMQNFFTFDKKTRMDYGIGVEYSYSSKYKISPNETKISAIKFYPTSPFVSQRHMKEAVATLLKQKDTFDKLYNT